MTPLARLAPTSCAQAATHPGQSDPIRGAGILTLRLFVDIALLFTVAGLPGLGVTLLVMRSTAYRRLVQQCEQPEAAGSPSLEQAENAGMTT